VTLPRRLLHVVHNFPPEFEGGTERYLAGLVTLQKHAGFEVSVLTGSDERSEEESREEDWHGVEVTRLLRRRGEDYGVTFRHDRILGVLERKVRERAPDLIHLHHWFNLGDVILSRLPEIPAVASFHDHYAACPRIFMIRPDGFFCGNDLPVPVARCVDCVRPDDPFPDLEHRIVERRSVFTRELERVSVALVPSRFHGDVLVRSGLIPAEKLEVLPLGIDPWPAPAAHRKAQGRLRLCTFGNLSRMKGTDLLLEAVRGLADKSRVELHLFGRFHRDEEGDLRARMEGLPVRYHGPYTQGSLARAAPDLDLAVFPSRAYETYGLVLEEAISLRLPLVVSNRGAFPERVQGFGRIVAVEEPSPLRSELEDLFLHPPHLDEMRRKLPAGPHRLTDHEVSLREIYGRVLRPRE